MQTKNVLKQISLLLVFVFIALAISFSRSHDQVKAQNGGGTLTIHSTGEGGSSSSGISGHSWIGFTPDGGETTTYGTFLGEGVVANRDLGRASEASRTAHINEAQEQNLMDYIDSQTDLGPLAWLPWHTCSSFASEGWEAGTGEQISPGAIPTPITLRNNIQAANGGQPHGDVGGGTHGGVESKPLSGLPSAFLGRDPAEKTSSAAEKFQPKKTVTLEDLIPTQGPDNTAAVPTIPLDALALTTTIDADAIDFVDNDTGATKAVILGIETAEQPHGHDYAVCSSFHGYSVDNVAPFPFPDLLPGVTEDPSPWFWYILTQKGELFEEAITFIVYVNEAEKTFLIDSQWLAGNYSDPIGFDFDHIFNFQIWSLSSEETIKLLERVIGKMVAFDNGSWTVSFNNTEEPSPATILMRKADYDNNEVQLKMQSWLTDTRTVTFYGSWRSFDDWDTSMGFNYEADVSPGTSTVILPFENLLDAVIVSNVDDFLSMVYVGSGFWFVFGDEQSTVEMIPGQCVPIESARYNELILAGCAQMEGTITTSNGYVGLVRTLNPNGIPVDVSHYQALTFKAKGDGKSYQVKLETDSVKDYDYHQFVFTPLSNEWMQYTIPLTRFKQQGWGTQVPFTGTDVKSIAWVSVGPHCDDSVHLEIDRVAFSNSLVISETTGPTSTNDTFNPYPIVTEIMDDEDVETATLYYSVNGNSFVGSAMTGGNSTFTGQIPEQLMESRIRYYIEATDVDGNRATDPVDAPHTTYGFRVEWFPSLLVDDFTDPNPDNVLGGRSGIFRDPDEGGIIATCYGGGILQISYDVTDHLVGIDEYAGYYSEIELADLRTFNSITFLVKGKNGGEKVKVGLNDGRGHEPKIEISEYLPNGITTNWQMTRIPLVAFASIADWSAIKSFTFAAEERIGSRDGTIYIDDVYFRPDAWPTIVDNFNDMTIFNGVGGYHSTFTWGSATINTGFNQTSPYEGTGASLAITYDVPTGSYAVWQTFLDDLDASGYRSLVLAVRGTSGGERFHLYLEDKDGKREYVEVTDYGTIGTDWQTIAVPLDVFKDEVNLTGLRHLQVAFEWDEMSGIVYLDDIHFALPPSPMITSLSPVAAANDVTTTLTLTGTNFLMHPTVALGYNILKNIVLLSSSTIRATIPAGTSAGVYDVSIVQPNMQFGVLRNAFTIFDPSWYGIYLPVVFKGIQ